FTHRDSAPVDIDPAMWTSTGQALLAEMANEPLLEKAAGNLVPVLRNFVKASLPDHMTPRSFVVVSHFPLMPGGKIDRRALPAPDFDSGSGTQFVAPRTPIEHALQAIWAAVLGTANPGVTDNFFALGGHSLKATQVVSRINHLLRRKVSLRDI